MYMSVNVGLEGEEKGQKKREKTKVENHVNIYN